MADAIIKNLHATNSSEENKKELKEVEAETKEDLIIMQDSQFAKFKK